MSGSARSLQSSSFSGLRVASLYFTPEYSKNGNNVSAKLEINAFMNMPGKANGGKGINAIIKLTTWGKLAHICAKSMSEGKEFNCTAKMHVFDKRVFMPTAPGQPGTPVLMPDGSPLTVKGTSFTINELTFGEESNKHIAKEIQLNVRPANWNVVGSVEAAQWKEILKARQAIQFDPNAPTGTYGYATIRMPQGAGIGAYIPQGTAAPVQVAPVATPAVGIPAAVAVNPVVGAVPAQPQAVPVATGGFVVPNGV